MKVLIIQLARFGDNFQTWPVVKSYKRNNPDVELHYLCRTTFKSSVANLEEIDRLWELDVAKHISYLQQATEDNMTDEISRNLEALVFEEFDTVINLTFSPLSSYITNILAHKESTVLGYTRHEDGYLNIPDDASALVFGQVGVNKYNRIHITRLLSAVVGIDLLEEDWRVPESILAKGALRFTDLPKKYIAVHIGGSSNHKLLSQSQWTSVLEGLIQKHSDLHIVLLGSKSEESFASGINLSNSEQLLNCVGQTQIEDLFYIINNSEFLLAPDSALVHMSSLLDKQCVNLSFGSVNFWETGPLAKKSYVFWSKSPAHIIEDSLVSAISHVYLGQEPEINHAKVQQDTSLQAYELVGYEARDFEWNMIKAIYLGQEFPILDDINVYNAFKQLAELTDMAIRDLEMVRSGQFQNVDLEIVANVEKLVETLEKLVPEVRPLVSWFNTEKVRIGPWSDQKVFDRNFDIYTQLRSVLAIYVGTSYTHSQVVEQK